MNSDIFIFTGKGGVGKTSLSAAFTRILSEKFPEKRILAVDADPAVGLATALNIEVKITVDDIRRQIADSIDRGDKLAAIELLNESRFYMLDAIAEKGNISFLSIGRPEGAGCYCKVNAYLKEVIGMIAENYDYVIIDGEAGIEQVNRRVIEKPDYIICVSDASKKGIQVMRTIKAVSDSLTSYKKYGVIFNRVPDGFSPASTEYPGELLAVIGDDSQQRDNDIYGKDVFALSSDSPLLKGAEAALKVLFG